MHISIKKGQNTAPPQKGAHDVFICSIGKILFAYVPKLAVNLETQNLKIFSMAKIHCDNCQIQINYQ